MTKIKLPSGKEALAIQINSLEDMTVDFFKKIDLNAIERYVCIHTEFEGKKIFVMATKPELKKAFVIASLKADLSFQMTNIAVLRQL